VSDDLDIPSPTYRVPRHRRGMDSGTRRLAIIAAGLGGGLVVLVGGWSLLGHHSTGVPVIEADSSPLRVKPENPGGMSVAGSNEEILSDGADGTVGKLAPASETPAPQNMQAAKPPVVASAPPPPPAAPPAPAPVAPPVVAAAPVAKPPAAAPVHVTAAESAHPMNGKGALVQLAALSSEDAAKVEWERLEKRMPDLLGKHQPAVSKFERDGKTFWRLRTGGFSDIAQATAFCEQVRAKGNGCSIAAF
jgi:hypothetical protein